MTLNATPCTVASLGPLKVKLPDGSTIPAASIAGITYSAGQVAYAIWIGQAPPLVIPIGSA